MELAFLKNRKQTVFGTIALITAILMLLYLNILLLMEDTFIGESFISILQAGTVCAVLGLFRKTKSRKYAVWALSLHIFMWLFTALAFGLSWMVSATP